MDSLIGEKAYIQPPAEASSEGPTLLITPSTSKSSSPLVLSENVQGNHKYITKTID